MALRPIKSLWPAEACWAAAGARCLGPFDEDPGFTAASDFRFQYRTPVPSSGNTADVLKLLPVQGP